MYETTDLIVALRTTDGQVMVPVESKHSAHSDMFQTLNLLAIDTGDGVAYFVVEGCAKFCPNDELQEQNRYFYEEHTCPTNFIRVPLISFKGDHDPHGLFRFVRSIWMTDAYKSAVDEVAYLVSVFEELANG